MIRIALLGAGIGAEHLAAYRALPVRFTVAAVCDLDLDRAAAITGGDPSIVLTDDAKTLLTASEIDLIDICLPPHLHVPTTLDALATGKHVIVEKPLAPSLAEADEIAAAAAAADRHVFPVFQYRYGPAISALKALIASGVAGIPLAASLETHWNRGADYYAVPWRGTWAGERGGAILGHAIHIHDLIADLLGPLAAVSARLTTRVNPIETEDCGAVILETASGVPITSSITLGSATDQSRLRLVFDRLTAESGRAPYAPATGDWSFTARDPADQPTIDACVAAAPPTQPGFTGFLNAVADALSGDPGRAVSLADGRRSVELVTALYHAARTGTRVALPLGADHPLYRSWLPGTGTHL